MANGEAEKSDPATEEAIQAATTCYDEYVQCLKDHRTKFGRAKCKLNDHRLKPEGLKSNWKLNCAG